MTIKEPLLGPVSKRLPRVSTREPIAIIGIGCRFPGGGDGPAAFWKLLAEGRDAITTVPADRWDLRSFYDPDPQKPGKASTYQGGFLNQIDHFDAHFFGISPREADYLDPQQRILLEVAWNSLEDAGLVPEHLAGRPVGVFMGAFTLDYKILQFQDREAVSTHTAVGAMMTIIAARLSYVFDLRGPCVSIDTACSSSLVAVHLACQSLWNQECELALAGGINVMTTPDYTIAESKGGFLSPDGTSKAFDSRANGYVRGEGAGVVVLKPLSAALADGDPIYAVIRSTATNHDGRTNGITVPSQEAQEKLIAGAYAQGGIEPHQVRYVEAHGTGTAVGDPIEAHALNNVLAHNRVARDKCIIGSCKTNIGHLEAAAGIAGLIKTALILKHRQVPPHLHFQQPNPEIPFDTMALRIPTSLEPLPNDHEPLFAGVNSFGFGGTNAHVLLEAVTESTSSEPAHHAQAEQDSYLLPLSARSPEALRELAQRYVALLTDSNCPPLADLLYTSTVRRSHHPYRLTITGNSEKELQEQLSTFLAGEERPNMSMGRVMPGQETRLVFVYTGMGPQWWAMGRQLYQQEPVFRETLQKCDKIFQQYAGWSILEAMLADKETSQMAETFVAQPANVVLQLALTALWRSWGIEPDAVIGHSVGEIVSAYVSGMLSLEDTLLVAYHRSRLQQRATGTGSMLAVGLAEDQVKHYLQGYEADISIAAINSPNAVTLAGDTEVLQKLAARFQEEQIFSKPLEVKVPYHSPCMEPIREELLSSLAPLVPRPASLPIYSTVTGERVNGLAFDASYWWQNVRHTVRFAAAAGHFIKDGYNIFLEVGPHPVLTHSIQECLETAEPGLGNRPNATLIASLRRKEAEKAKMLGALGALYCAGYPIEWSRLYEQGNIVPIPTYPWQRERYWAESETARQKRLGHRDHPLLGRRLPAPFPLWEGELNPYYLAYLRDHCIQGVIVYPGAGYIEMALAVAAIAYQSESCQLEGLSFHKALFLAAHSVMKTQVYIDPQTAAFEIYSRPAGTDGSWTLNSTGRLRQLPPNGNRKRADFQAEIAVSCPEVVQPSVCYAQFQQKGFDYGPAFQGVRSLRRGRYDALAEIELLPTLQDERDDYFLHPALLDACFQALVAVDGFGQNGDDPVEVYLPVSIERFRIYARPGNRVWSYAHVVEKSEKSIVGDICLFDDEGHVLVEIQGFRAQSLSGQVATRPDSPNDWLYEMVWQPQERNEQTARHVEPGTWLILMDETGTGAALVQQLEALGHSCIIVHYGEEFSQEGQGSFRVNPADVTTIEHLLESILPEQSSPLRGIVHLWSLDMPDSSIMTLAELRAFEGPGLLALTHLVQVLATRGDALPLWIVTRGAQPVAGEPLLNVAPASLWGLGRVIGHQEHVKLWGGALDLDPEALAGDVQGLVAELLNSDEEDQIALRQGQRYVVRLVHSETPPTLLPPSIRTDASYLITGGMGALGLLVAKWLVKHGARSLVLMSRTPLPPRHAWNQVQPGSPLADRIAGVRALEARGATICVAAVDVTDKLQLLRFLADYQAEGRPPIRGVIHSAGLVEDRLLTQMNDEIYTRVLRPKVLGAWALHETFKKEPLDFFVLFSSVASLVAQTGQGNYAAGNAFLDALAFYRRAQGLPALTINWGPWLVGMIEELDLVEHYRRRGMDSIAAETGIEILEQLFSFQKPQVAVIAADWPLVLEYYPRIPQQVAHLGVEPEVAEEEGQVEEVPFLQQLAHLEPSARRPFIEARLLALLARVLRMKAERLEGGIPLTALGMDSLIATELRNRIDLQLGINLTVVELLQGLTVAQLAERSLVQLEPQIEQEARLVALLSGEVDAAALQELATEEILAQLLDEVEPLSEEDVVARLG